MISFREKQLFDAVLANDIVKARELICDHHVNVNIYDELSLKKSGKVTRWDDYFP